MISPGSGAKAPSFAVLIHEKGGSERRERFASAEISVGRVQGNDIVLPKGNVSKRHARVLYRDGRFIITDLNSTNGTYVNRRRITQATIVREGDKIYVGDFVLKIEPARAGDEAEPSLEPESARTTSRSDSQPPSVPESPSYAGRGSIPDEVPGRPTTMSLEPSTPAATPRGSESAELAEHTEPSEVIGALVARVAERLGPGRDLGRPGDAPLQQTVDRLLQETWAQMEHEAVGLPADRVLGRARAELVDLGPLGDLIADESVLEIGIPRFDRLVVARASRPTSVEPGFSSELSLGWALHRLCEQGGAPLRAGETFFERRLSGGLGLQGVLALGPAGALAHLRRPKRPLHSLEDLLRRGTLSRAMVSFLQHCLVARLNLLVVGPRDGGAEVLLGALAMSPVDGTPVWVSEASQAPLPGMPRLDPSQPAERLQRALRLAARLPGTRLMVDLMQPGMMGAVVEVTGEGTDGVVGSRTGAGLGRALSRLAVELTAQGLAPNLASARELVAGSFDLAIEVLKLRDGRQRAVRIAEIQGAGFESFQLSDIFSFVADRTAAGGVIEGTFVSSGTVPRIAEAMRARGVQLETALFSRPMSR